MCYTRDRADLTRFQEEATGESTKHLTCPSRPLYVMIKRGLMGFPQKSHIEGGENEEKAASADGTRLGAGLL